MLARMIALSLLGLASVFTSMPARADSTLADRLKTLGGKKCRENSLTCVSIDVPRNRQAAGGPKMKITFAVSLAKGDSKGVLFYLVGGPGTSGVASAESYYLSAFDESLTKNLDIVFMDQRGTGAVHGLKCPVAQVRFDTADLALHAPEKAVAAAKAYAQDCVAELKAGDFLGHLGTVDAVDDAEDFRQAIGAPKVWLYGESYGTQFAQTYATRFPQAPRGVILDGVVDLNLSTTAYYAAYSSASEHLLGRTLSACDSRPDCARDMGEKASRVYDRLSRRLERGPIMVDFVLADGVVVKRPLTYGLWSLSATYSMFAPAKRGAYLRALSAAARGDFSPMLQLSYSLLGFDMETDKATEDPTWYGAGYYAITCADYSSGTGTPEARARRIVAEAQSIARKAPRLVRSYFAEQLACAFWPQNGPAKRPAPFAGGDYPTLVMNGDTDPVTPISMAYSVFDHVRNGYGVFMKNGPHVLWGRGNACPDRIMDKLLFEGVLPKAREMHCAQDFLSGYTPISLTHPRRAAPLSLARAMETELQQSIGLSNWSGSSPVSVGCNRGGTISATSADDGTTAYVFHGCSFWQGIVMDGTGIQSPATGNDAALTLDLTVKGQREGKLAYRHDTATQSWALSGTLDGKPVHLTRGYP